MNNGQIIRYRKAATVQLLFASLGQDVQEYPSTLKEVYLLPQAPV